MSKQIKVSDEVHQRLMGAKSDTETVSDLIARLLDDGERLAATTVPIDDAVARILDGRPAPIDEADALLERLDNENEHPEDSLSPEDRELFERLEPGELPECCQEYYTSGTKCRHWHKEYVNYYGKRVIGYRNTLTGGTNYDYQTLYRQ